MFYQTPLPTNSSKDLREAQTPSHTGNTMPATFARHAALFCRVLRAMHPCQSTPPRPAPLHFSMHLLRLPHTVPLSQMRPPNSRSQSSFLGASAPMTHWIDSPLFTLHGNLSDAHITIPSTWMPLSVSAAPVVVTFALLSQARSSTPRHRCHHVSRFNLP